MTQQFTAEQFEELLRFMQTPSEAASMGNERPNELETARQELLGNISGVLGCDPGEIRDIYPLKEGLTNLSFHFSTPQGEYVYRHPGIGTEQLIDRQAEFEAQVLALRLGLDETFVHEDRASGWKISRYLPDCRTLNAHEDAQLAEAMRIARTLHSHEVEVPRRFDFFDESKRYERILLEKGPISAPGYLKLASDVERLAAFVRADEAPVCLTHNDFFELNLLRDAEGKLYLIDWEYAGMADYASDFGTFVVTSKLDDSEALRALAHYFDRTPTKAELRHNLAFVCLAGWCWYLWSLVKESEGDDVGEWLAIYYDYAERYLPKALALYEDDGEEESAS